MERDGIDISKLIASYAAVGDKVCWPCLLYGCEETPASHIGCRYLSCDYCSPWPVCDECFDSYRPRPGTADIMDDIARNIKFNSEPLESRLKHYLDFHYEAQNLLDRAKRLNIPKKRL